MGGSDRIFDQDQGTFLIADFESFLTAKDSPALVKASLDGSRLNSEELSYRYSGQGIVDIVETTDIDLIVLTINSKGRAIVLKCFESGQAVV